MRKTVFLHIGAPKTGTSSLQSHLWANRDALLDHGVYVPGTGQVDHFHAGSDLRGDPIREGEARTPGAWARLVAQLDDNDAPVALISDERLSRASSSGVATALATLSAHDVHLIYGVRDFAGLLPSEWQQNVKMSGAAPLDTWLEELASAGHDWFWGSHDLNDVFERWDLPNSNIHVVIAPPPSAGRDELWRRFASVIGAPAALPNRPPRTNESLGFDETELVRRIYRHIEGPPPPVHVQHLMRTTVSRQTLARRDDTRTIRLPLALRPWVIEQARRRHEFLARSEFDIVGDLAELAVDDGRFVTDPMRIEPERVLDAGTEISAVLLLQMRKQREGPRDQAATTAPPAQQTPPNNAPRFGERARQLVRQPDQVRPALERRLRIAQRQAVSVITRRPALTYYLHIGAPFTGPTSLSPMLWRNQQILRRDGIYVPGELRLQRFLNNADADGPPTFAHAWSGRLAQDWERLTGAAERSGYQKVVISDELLAHATDADVSAVMDRLEGAQVHVVYAVSDLVTVLAAAWQRRILSDPVAPWTQWLDELAAGASPPWLWSSCDVGDVLKRWRAGGADAVDVVVVPHGPDSALRLWQRFQSLVGSTSADAPEIPAAARSISDSHLELLRRIGEKIGERRPPWQRRQASEELIATWLDDGIGLHVPDRFRSWVATETDRRLVQITDRSHHVVGDLADLTPAASAFDAPDQPLDERSVLDAVESLVARLLGAAAAGPVTPADAAGARVEA